MGTAKKILFINPQLDNSYEGIREQFNSLYPNSNIEYWSPNDGNFFEKLKSLRKMKSEEYEYSFFPARADYFNKLDYWTLMFIFLITPIGKLRTITTEGKVYTLPDLVLSYGFFLQPLFALVVLLRVPICLVREVFIHFILTPDNPDDEFVGFGKGKGVGGLIYWLTLSWKMKKYGVYGIATDTYWGMPLGVHSWPLAIWMLKILGYRRFIYVASLLFIAGFSCLAITLNSVCVILLLPLVLCSTYYLFNIYIGTLELLPWSFVILSIASAINHMPVLGGIFLGVTLLSHPGISMLSCLIYIGFFIGYRLPFIELTISGVIALVVSIWFILPYWRSKDKLGRDELQNVYINNPHKWTFEVGYRFFWYALIIVIGVFQWKLSLYLLIPFLFPLVATYYNIKIKWVFSMYTELNFMLVMGAVFTILVPTPIQIVLYLILIFTNPTFLINPTTKELRELDLTPIKLGDTRLKINNAFERCREGLIGFERGHNIPGNSLSNIASITYVQANRSTNLFNASYAEIGDYQIYERTVHHFHASATKNDFEIAAKFAGIKYMVAFSPDFSQQLVSWGYTRLDQIDGLNISDMPDQTPASMCIFELPCHPELISPSSNIKVDTNEMQFMAKAGQRYDLNFSAFKGWHGFQNEKRIPIVDNKPGMSITPPYDGLVTLKYKYWNYWSL